MKHEHEVEAKNSRRQNQEMERNLVLKIPFGALNPAVPNPSPSTF